MSQSVLGSLTASVGFNIHSIISEKTVTGRYLQLRNAKVLLVCLLILPAFRSASQDSLIRGDAYRFADATLHTYTQPIRWKKKQWLTFGGVLAGTAAISLLDRPVRNLFVQSKNDFPQFIEDMGYHYGKPYSAFTFTGGFYLVGLIFNNRWAKDTGLNLGVTLLTSGLLQTALKDVIGRARPGTEMGPYRFKIPSKGDIGYHSFPSGHSAVAFGITLVLARRIESQPVKIIFYSLAASTTLSRLHTDSHWFSDMAFGALLAWACDETVSKRLLNNRLANPRLGKIHWSVEPTGYGFALTGKF